jgi:hypothetical protein
MKFLNSGTKNVQTILRKYFSFKNETLSLEPFAEILDTVKHAYFKETITFLKKIRII